MRKINLKNVKQTKKTFTMIFEFEDFAQLRKLKALSIYLGNLNPMRKEIKNLDYVVELLEEEEKIMNFEFLIREISKEIK
jgi:hypothetical protein